MIGADDFSFFGMDRLEMVAHIFTSWNQLMSWLHQADGLRAAA